MRSAQGSQDWLDAGLEALVQGGVDRVRVEVLAQALGVTKGGFYRRFRDRAALLEAMLNSWASGRIAAVGPETALAGEAPRERLRKLIRQFAERLNAPDLSIELAVRQWARSDPRAAAAVARVDEARLAAVTELYAQLGLGPEDARTRGLIIYAFIFGQGLLQPDASATERYALMAACADTLVAI